MRRLRSGLGRRRVLVGAGVVAVVAAAAIAVALPFGGSAPAASVDNGTPTATQRIVRRDLTSQTQVSATLGYADPATISAPSGTAPSAVQQAQQSATSSAATLATDRATLAQAQAVLAGDDGRLAVDCHGSNAAQVASASGGGACASDAQAVASDRQSVTSAATKVHADELAAAAAGASLAQAQASAGAYGQGASYTMLPAIGTVVRRGQPLYAIAGIPAVLLYGGTAAWRPFAPGMSSGADVAELNANLRALGYGDPAGSAYTSATAAAIERLQSTHGLAPTGTLLLGSVVFQPGAVRVTTVTPTAGGAVQAGPVLTVTSLRRVVTIALDASQQTSVKAGDPVTITLPDNSTTPGRVSFVGTVATTPSDSGNGGGQSSPTIEVDVTPDHPGATGRLNQAPVDVSIVTDSATNVLVVPVNALLALASGGYAVEQVEPGGVHRLVGVTVGLFDDADGLVQVDGAGLAAGQRVVVPAE